MSCSTSNPVSDIQCRLFNFSATHPLRARKQFCLDFSALCRSGSAFPCVFDSRRVSGWNAFWINWSLFVIGKPNTRSKRFDIEPKVKPVKWPCQIGLDRFLLSFCTHFQMQELRQCFDVLSPYTSERLSSAFPGIGEALYRPSIRVPPTRSTSSFGNDIVFY